jgi:NodT family efflux transporter outer membrane factor (OMF) lipoprotein
VQRDVTAAQRGPDVNATAGVNRQRQSEHGAGTRIIDAVGGNREALIGFLSDPFTLYQTGFDASWELDLWGRVRRSIEAADADVANQAALLDLSRLSLVSDVARSYFELRSTQENIRLSQEDIQALVERLELMQARLDVGAIDHIDIARQRTELAGTRAQLPRLLAQEAASKNQLLLLIGQRRITGQALDSSPPKNATPLPELALGLPSEVATGRPDVRAAQARLYRATARIGVARADLYPSIRLGARGGLESYLSSEISDWGSRTWSIGPTLNLPLFDRGRLKGVVVLRELEQQAAAVDYQRTVLSAWHEIDDALNAYEAERQQLQQQRERRDSAADAYALIQARYEGGVVDFSSVLDTQRNYIQARRDLAASEAQTRIKFATINKVVGNVPATAGDAGYRLSTRSD